MNHRGNITFNAMNVSSRVLGTLRIYKADYILNISLELVWKLYSEFIKALSFPLFPLPLYFFIPCIWPFTMAFKVTFCVLYFLKYSLL